MRSLLSEPAGKRAEVVDELDVAGRRQTFDLFTNELIARGQSDEVRCQIDLQVHVVRKVGASACRLWYHSAISAIVMKLGEVLQVKVAVELCVVVEKANVSQISNIPHETARLWFERVLPKYENIRDEVPNRLNILVSFGLLDAPFWRSKVCKSLTLSMKVEKPPINSCGLVRRMSGTAGAAVVDCGRPQRLSTALILLQAARSHAGRLYSHKLPAGSNRFGYRIFMFEALFCLMR